MGIQVAKISALVVPVMGSLKDPFHEILMGVTAENLAERHEIGLRMLSFAWMRRTAYGDGAWENDSRGGLTRLGHAAVGELNRLGIMVDVSHSSKKASLS